MDGPMQALASPKNGQSLSEEYAQVFGAVPDRVESLVARGTALAQEGKRAAAIHLFRDALRLRPAHAKAHHNLGVALSEEKQFTPALASFRAALRAEPTYAEAHYNLGNVLGELDRDEEAILAFKDAIRHKPDYVDAFNNMGLALTRLGRPEEAAVYLRQAVRLRPDFAEGFNNLGLAYAQRGNFATAEGCYERAFRLKPAYADAHTNLGSAFKEQGRLQEAVAAYDLALVHEPDSATTHWNRSLAWLQMGNFEQGWKEYEWRWKRRGGWRVEGGGRGNADFRLQIAESNLQSEIANLKPPLSPSPRPSPPSTGERGSRWDGAPLEGRTILLVGEQGQGDMIQFIRYAPLVKERGGKLIVKVARGLVGLFASCAGVDEVVALDQEAPSCDVQAPLMSLPGIFGTTLSTVPAAVPYLKADAGKVEEWRGRVEAAVVGRICNPSLGISKNDGDIGQIENLSYGAGNVDGSKGRIANPSYKIGVVWQGNPRHKWDRHRSVPLALLEPLARVKGVTLISLQRDAGAEQVGALKDRFAVLDLRPELADFTDTAALMKCLDLVVCCDTSVAHLAGALGIPVWVALSTIVDWRWLLGRDDSPWYPTMRLFRQERLGEWRPVFERMAEQFSFPRSAWERTLGRSASRIQTGVCPRG